MENMLIDTFDLILDSNINVNLKYNYINICMLGYISGRMKLFFYDNYMISLLSKKRNEILGKINNKYMNNNNNKAINYVYEFGKIIGENNIKDKSNITKETIIKYEKKLLKSK